jgi:serine/threonine protein kinase
MANSDARLIWELYAAALEHEPAERSGYLERACPDPAVRAQVASLLESHGLDIGPSTRPDSLRASNPETITRSAGDAVSLAGRQIGNYVVQRELGRGGMGVVYLAQDVRLGRTVAIKALSPAYSQSPTVRQRLLNEAKMAAALSHPGIATVYALEEIDGELYMACEYVPGAPLRALVESGPLPIVDVIDIGLQLARALAEAHTKGIVHRDIKPENVIKTPSGVIKVLDFGLARAEYTQTRLTQTGMLVGTPAYLAPEQALGLETDFRTDIFALGLLLYELASGTNPFAAGSIPATIARIVDENPPLLSDVQPGSVPELDRIIERCLQKDPRARYRATHEIAGDLERLLAELSGRDRPGSQAGAATTPRQTALPRSRRWLVNHHVVMSVVYIGLLYPAWFARGWLPSPWNSGFLLGMLAAAAAGASLRLHLWFTAITFPNQFAEQQDSNARWTRTCDLAFAGIQIAAAFGISGMHPEFAMLFVGAAVAILIGSFVIEPATVRAALSPRRERGL